MKSKSFSRCKRIRCKTKSFQKLIKQIKTDRIRKDRRLNRMILKYTQNQDNIINIILRNDGNLQVA